MTSELMAAREALAALRKENARLTTAVRFKEQTDKLNGVLRAHVAALIREWKLLLAGDESAKVSVALLITDSPDLAALAAAAQAREAVVAAAREEAAKGTSDTFERMCKALAALDAAQGR
jgi:hypothetical protein